jgi:hypothetical protein
VTIIFFSSSLKFLKSILLNYRAYRAKVGFFLIVDSSSLFFIHIEHYKFNHKSILSFNSIKIGLDCHCFKWIAMAKVKLIIDSLVGVSIPQRRLSGLNSGSRGGRWGGRKFGARFPETEGGLSFPRHFLDLLIEAEERREFLLHFVNLFVQPWPQAPTSQLIPFFRISFGKCFLSA